MHDRRAESVENLKKLLQVSADRPLLEALTVPAPLDWSTESEGTLSEDCKPFSATNARCRWEAQRLRAAPQLGSVEDHRDSCGRCTAD